MLANSSNGSRSSRPRFPLALGDLLSPALLCQLSFMSDLHIQVLIDPFADANAEDSGAGGKEHVHIRIQQRNGRKSLTTVQGLKKEFSYNNGTLANVMLNDNGTIISSVSRLFFATYAILTR
ncbi:hypothetical protein V6N13_009731 [Hibiscus sabdariffa]|uniref:SUI1 domain-containing protein n=2 Tax=Hibiscus sabdariffa TaxID=183260 RepID=A0ABR2B4F6_9ROSI